MTFTVTSPLPNDYVDTLRVGGTQSQLGKSRMNPLTSHPVRLPRIPLKRRDAGLLSRCNSRDFLFNGATETIMRAQNNAELGSLSLHAKGSRATSFAPNYWSDNTALGTTPERANRAPVVREPMAMNAIGGVISNEKRPVGRNPSGRSSKYVLTAFQ